MLVPHAHPHQSMMHDRPEVDACASRDVLYAEVSPLSPP